LDTLSQFIGKESWRAFRTDKKSSRFHFKINEFKKSSYDIFGFFLALIIIGIIGNRSKEVVINVSDFSLSSKVLSNEYPNSVVFDFNIPNDIDADSLFIQQYWDVTKTISISKGQKKATGIYYFPGYFKAKLLVNNKSVQEHDLFLKSNGWLGLVEYNPVPKYFIPELKKNTGIYVPRNIEEEIIHSELPLFTSYHFVDDIVNVSGDNFTLKATIQNRFDEKWAICHSLRIFFIGKDGAMIIPFSKIGCSSDNNIMLNDVYLNGKENDLSALSADFTDPTDLSIKVRQKVVDISINGKHVYSLHYQAPMGELVGLRFKFLGLGEVIDFKIYNDQSEEVIL